MDAVKLNPLDQTAKQIVFRMDKLFEVDAVSRERGYTHLQRNELRQELVPPMLKELETELKKVSLTALPSSALGKGANYTISLWEKLNRFLKYPEIELSTNLAENSMRGVALGRNYAQSRIMCSPPLASAA